MMAQVLEDLGLDATSEVSNPSKWIRWLFECQRDLGLPIVYDVIPFSARVIEGRVDKPRGFVIMRQARLLGELQGYPLRIIPSYKPIRRGLCEEFENTDPTLKYLFEYQVEEYGQYWQFSSNCEGMEFNIEYRGYKFDEDGWPYMDANFKDSFVAYCRYQHIRASRTSGFQQFSLSDEDAARRDWMQYRLKNKSTNFYNEISIDALNQIMAMVNDPFFVSTSLPAIQNNRINTLWATRGLGVRNRIWGR